MPINTIIFDFNGLIIDDEPVHCALFQQVLLEEDIMLTDTQYWSDYLGFDDKGLIEAIYKRDGLKLTPKKLKDLVAKKNERYFPALQQKLKLFSGVEDFIQEVAQKFHLAIVSGALRSEIDFVLEKSGLKKYFPIIISADDTKHGKPDPEGFMLALAHLKKKHPEVRPETCLVLEDSLAGIESAHRAQMKVVALTHTYDRAELTAADFVVDKFSEIERVCQFDSMS
jgi:beta-phosphoglucomutase